MFFTTNWVFAKHRSTQKPLKVWNYLKILAAVSLVGYLASKTELNELVTLWQETSPEWLSAAALLFYLSLLITACRHWILIGRNISFAQFLATFIMQRTVSTFVATTAGVVPYIIALRRRYRIGAWRGLSSLLIATIMDIMIAWLSLAFASKVVWNRITAAHWTTTVLLLSVPALLVMLLFGILLRNRLMAGTKHLLKILRFHQRLYQEFSNASGEILSSSWSKIVGQFGSVFPITSLGWSLELASCYCMIRSFALPIDAWAIVFISSIVRIISIVPVQVFGGLGVADVTVMYLFMLFGISQGVIIPVIIGTRLLYYSLSLSTLLYLPLGNWIGESETAN